MPALVVYSTVVTKLATAFELTANKTVFISPTLFWLPSTPQLLIQVVPDGSVHQTSGGSSTDETFDMSVAIFQQRNLDTHGRWHKQLTNATENLFDHRATLINTLHMNKLIIGSTPQLLRPLQLIQERPIQYHSQRMGLLCWEFIFRGSTMRCLI